MRTGSSQHVISYKGDSDESNLTTILAGASSFDASDVEVLYRGHGGTILHFNLKELRHDILSFFLFLFF